jgi:hypothetical protein
MSLARRSLLCTLFCLAALLLATLAQAFDKPICPQSYTGCTGTPTLTTPSGATVVPEIAIMFWQDTGANTWGTGSGANSPTYTQLVADSLAMVNSPYFAKLSQYGGSGMMALPRLAPFAPIYTGPAPNSGGTTSTMSWTDLTNLVNTEIAGGYLPGPQHANMIYVVFTPNGTGVCGFNGCNNPESYTDGTTYQIAQVGGSQTCGSTCPPNNPVTLTHEVTEAITRWQGLLIKSGECSISTQVSDLCTCQPVNGNDVVNDMQVEAYWSAHDNACVVPDSWNGTNTPNGSGGWNWVGPTFMRQAYGGSGGVVYTDTSDNGWFGYNGGTGWQFSGSNAIFAAGAGIAAVVGSSTSSGCPPNESSCLDFNIGIGVYNLGGQYWVGNIGLPSGLSPAVGMTLLVDGLGHVITTNAWGEPYCWASSTGWKYFGGNIINVDQIIATGQQVLALSRDHSKVYALNGGNDCTSNPGWSQVSFSGFAGFNQLIGTVDSDNWGAQIGNLMYPDAQPWTNPGNQWFQGLQFASASGTYDYLAMTIPSVLAFGETSAGNPWTNMNSGPVGKLISGNRPYVTGCLTNPPACVAF